MKKLEFVNMGEGGIRYVVRLNAWMAPPGRPASSLGYKSRFGRFWWFWLPRMLIQSPCVSRDYCNPRVVRLIWLCFATGLEFGLEGVPFDETD